MRLIIAIACAVFATPVFAASSGGTVWINGSWQGSGSSRTWVPGCYEAPVCAQPVTVHSVPYVPVACPPPVSRQPSLVWVDAGWVWTGCDWAWREGYWAQYASAPVARPCPPPTRTVVVERHPAISIGVGLGIGWVLGSSHHRSSSHCHR